VTLQKSTTPDLVELTRAAYAALNSRDFDSVSRMFDPAGVWDVSRWGLGTHTGLERIRHFLEDWFGSLDRYQVQVEEVHALGNGVLWLTVVQIAQPGGSRGLLRVPSAPVFVWAQGKITRVTVYRDVDEARAAAEGLAEERR
jgi:ketosteroid isomerase-like protein